MTNVEAYDRAVELWGDKAAALALGDRCIVGRWVPKTNLELVGGYVLATSTAIVLEVMGEGETFAAAWGQVEDRAAAALGEP